MSLALYSNSETDNDPVLSVRDLRTEFLTRDGPLAAIAGVTFDVRRGETVGIVGESGSGKSVTALSILRLLPRRTGRIASGSIRLCGEELTTATEARMRRIRGNVASMVFQEPMTSLNPVLKIGWQLGEAIRAHQGLRGAAARRKAIEMLSLVRIPEPERRLGQFPFELSGGMRQRVMIAMALACDPALLIADEATTALDVTVQAQILRLLLELRQKIGLSVIMITHDLGVVAETCDRMVVMYAGKVVETGTVRDVFRNPRHPYTKGLLTSIPRLPEVGRPLPASRPPLRELSGFVPSLRAMPDGCRFADRCALAAERCREEEPPLLDLSGGRQTACFEHQRLREDAHV